MLARLSSIEQKGPTRLSVVSVEWICRRFAALRWVDAAVAAKPLGLFFNAA